MKTIIKWGATFSVMTICWITLEKLLGFHDQRIQWHPVFTMLIFFPAVAVYVYAFRERRNELGGKATFKELMLFGLSVSVVVAVLAPLAQWLVFKFITPTYFQNAINAGLAQGYKLEALQANFNLASYAVQGSIGSIVIGAITSLVLALIMRTKKQ